MIAKKYDKYIIEYDPKKYPKERRPVMAYMDGTLAEGSHFYLIHWVVPGFAANLGDFKYAGHPPHIHKDAELLFHIGTDPKNPMDLGAEVVMYLGPEWKSIISPALAVSGYHQTSSTHHGSR